MTLTATETETTAIPIPPIIKHAMACAAKENSRYTINGVAILRAPSGRELAMAATDGRQLFLATWPAEVPDCIGSGIIIPSADIRTLRAAKIKDTAHITFRGGDWFISQGGKQSSFIPADGTFPPCFDAVPDVREESSRPDFVYFNPSLLGPTIHAISKSPKTLCVQPGNQVIDIYHRAQNKPLVASAFSEFGPEGTPVLIRAVIMPRNPNKAGSCALSEYERSIA